MLSLNRLRRCLSLGPGFALDCRSDAAEAVVKATGMKGAKVFFTNAGAGANENALKIARQFTETESFLTVQIISRFNSRRRAC